MSSLTTKRQGDRVTLLDSAARTETGTGSAVRLPGFVNAVAFELDVTAAATEVGDTLDVNVQTRLDGTNWVNVVAFTQVVGNGGAKRHIAKITADGAETMFEASASLSAGSVRHLLGDDWRISWSITDASTDNASFTFSVTAMPM